MKSIVFALTSPAGGGKDTCAELIKRYCEYLDMDVFKMAYGDAVKWHCMRNFGYVDKDKDRHILQEFGTKVRSIEPDFWVRQVYNTIDAFSDMYDVFVISDVRYENELQPFPWKLSYPIVNVYIEPHGESTLTADEFNHESEDMANNPDMVKFHYIIDNSGTLKETNDQIVLMVNDVLEKQAEFLMAQRGLEPEESDIDE